MKKQHKYLTKNKCLFCSSYLNKFLGLSKNRLKNDLLYLFLYLYLAVLYLFLAVFYPVFGSKKVIFNEIQSQ